jgi:hypothetical protein
LPQGRSQNFQEQHAVRFSKSLLRRVLSIDFRQTPVLIRSGAVPIPQAGEVLNLRQQPADRRERRT